MSPSSLIELSTTELSAAIVQRQVSCVEVMQSYLEHINVVNPKVNAIVALQPEEQLLQQAKQADNSPSTGWLHGVPVAIKDLSDAAGIPTTLGSPLLKGFVPSKDSSLASRIRGSGAIIIGKTNTPEFGLGSHSYNSVYGVTRNPYNIKCCAGGSSGGAAAALAARLLPIADGSDMMGSLRNPAAFCNVYGLRPSYGLVPSETLGDSFLHQLSTSGPMARTVEDLARLLDTLSATDASLPHSYTKPVVFAEQLQADMKGKRIAWLGDWQGHLSMEEGILSLCESGLNTFSDLGCHIDAIDPGFSAQELWESWVVLRSFAAGSGLNAFYQKPESRDLLKPEALWEIERYLSFSAADIQDASVIRSHWYKHCATLFDQYDALVLPSAQVFPFPAEWDWPKEIAGKPMQTYHQWMEVVVPASITGLPALSVPVGFNDSGLPMGMQLIGRRGDDLGLLQLGEQYHQATQWSQQRPLQLY